MDVSGFHGRQAATLRLVRFGLGQME